MNFFGPDTDAPFSYRDKASPVKYGDEKEKLFPTAARLQAIRRMLEGIRDGAVPARPERVTSAKWSQFKSYVKKDYAIVSLSGCIPARELQEAIANAVFIGREWGSRS